MADTTPPATINDLFQALVRVRAAREHQALKDLHDVVVQHVINERHWLAVLGVNAWRRVLAQRTPRQVWLIDKLWDQTRECWSKVGAHVQANRLTEAHAALKDYESKFKKWADLHHDLFDVSRAGGATERVGENLLPPGYREQLIERDRLGRIALILERSSA